jgi:diguanylate cyclase (GGDEF)-like protein
MAESPPDPIPLLQRPLVQSLLLQAATHDGETGCLTEAYLAQRAAEEIARRQRYGGRLSLLLVGPDAQAERPADGPAPLVRLANRLRARLRATDLVGRWGEQELVVLLPGTGLAGATRLGRRIVASAAGEEAGPPLLVSVGVATWLGAAETLGLMVERARRGLLEARARGGGRVGVG